MDIFSFSPEIARSSSHPTCRPAPFGSAASHRGDGASDLKDSHFVQLLGEYRGHGGLSRSQHLASRFDATPDHSSKVLDQWLANGTLFSLDWQGAAWVPLFQFAAGGLVPCPRARSIVAELTPTFSGWELADWFVAPNNWLNGTAPIESLATNTDAVRQAARVDRFIAAG